MSVLDGESDGANLDMRALDANGLRAMSNRKPTAIPAQVETTIRQVRATELAAAEARTYDVRADARHLEATNSAAEIDRRQQKRHDEAQALLVELDAQAAARSAAADERSRTMERYTFWLIVLTFAVLVLTGVLVVKAFGWTD